MKRSEFLWTAIGAPLAAALGLKKEKKLAPPSQEAVTKSQVDQQASTVGFYGTRREITFDEPEAHIGSSGIKVFVKDKEIYFQKGKQVEKL